MLSFGCQNMAKILLLKNIKVKSSLFFDSMKKIKIKKTDLPPHFGLSSGQETQNSFDMA